MRGERDAIRAEFARVAAHFDARAGSRFDDLGIVGFARVPRGATVVEVGAGTGAFLSLFEPVATTLVAIDLTVAMLEQARRKRRRLQPVVGDAYALPLASRSIDLVCSAQMLHHVHRPLAVVKEMRRVAASDGAVLIVDQVSTESYEQIAFMNELEALRDPSHASSRPPSALHIMVRSAGLEIVDERVVARRERMSSWMSEPEFPPDRIERVRRFVERFGHETGMEFEREADDFSFTRRRIMILARRAGATA